MATNSKGASVMFSNYNYAFIYFNQKYVDLCVAISETMSLRTVRRNISAFMFEFSYAIPKAKAWDSYREQLNQIDKAVSEDHEFMRVIEKEELSFREEVKAYPLYYRHLLKYLNLLSEYVGELSPTYMPRTKMQRNLLKYKNDSPFYDKLHELKGMVFNALRDFQILELRTRLNSFITYYYAYKLFVNEVYSNSIEEIIGLVLSIFTNKSTIDLLAKYPDFSNKDLREIYKLETTLHNAILDCNSLVNMSLSSYGVIPKIEPKVYNDRWLI